MATDMDCEDFLEVVYGDREGWIDLPAKTAGYWVPFHTEWPADGTVSRRIDSSLRDREDLYYSVAQFAERGRRIEDVLPTGWLWADLDEVHPTDAAKLGYLPTLAVQSSPGRYQALWRLDRELPPSIAEKLNRALSYVLDADKGGWDLTQVLRIPGTRNFKYPDSPLVELMWYRPELVYSPARLWQKLKTLLPAAELQVATNVDIERRDLPRRAKILLRTRPENVVEGERSARMWELECLLAESGLTEEEIFALVWPTAWNKWAGVRTGQDRLRREIRKAVARVRRAAALKSTQPERSEEELGSTKATDEPAGGEEDDTVPLPFVGYSSFLAMRMEEPRWLVKDMWTAGSHGIIGGEPKTSKTTLALALALAVASGKPFLDKFPVGVQGPVLFVQEENAPWVMQDRLRKLAALSGLVSKRDVEVRTARRADLARKGKIVVELELPSDVPLRMLNNWGFDLSLEEHRDALEAEVDRLRPAMVVLDPLYLILGDVDTDKAGSLRPYLKWLMALRYEYGTAVVLVHHMRKKNTAAGATVVRPGQNLLGSAILHGWVDSAIYCGVREPGGGRVGWTGTMVDREFRSMAPQAGMEIDWNMGEPGSLDCVVDIRRFDIGGLIVKRVAENPGITLNQLADMLDMDRRTLLGRLRGAEPPLGVRIETGGRGRGMTHRLYPSDTDASESSDEGDD